MANKLGQLNCFADSKNTGFGTCVLDWDTIQGAFIFDRPRTFTKAEVADLIDTLQNAASTDVKANRMFPVHAFVAPTDNSEAVVIETFDYGAKEVIRDGDIDWSFQFRDGGACLLNSLRTHNGKRWVMFYDKKNTIMGYNKSGDLATIPLQFFYAETFKLKTGSKSTGYMIRFCFQAKYANEEAGALRAEFDLSEIQGLQDVGIVVNTFNQNTGLVNATLELDCGADNIYDLYNNQINATSFIAYDQDGNVVPILSVVKVPGSKTFNITLKPQALIDNTTVTLQGAPISKLVSQGIIGYEIDSVGLEVPGS